MPAKRTFYPRLRTRILRLTVFAVFTLSIALFAVSAFAYKSLTTVASCGQPDQSDGGVTPANFTLSERDATAYRMSDYQSVQFPTRNGSIMLSGWYIPSDLSNQPTMIVVHGLSSCRQDATILLAAGILHRAGFNVLLIDLRNHGNSGKDNGLEAMGTKEYLDVLGAWDWLCNDKGARPEQVGLLGFSLGAISVIDAGGAEPRVAAVWADSPFYNADEEIDYQIQYMGVVGKLKPLALLAGRVIFGDDLTNTQIQPAMMVTRYANRFLFITQGADDVVIPSTHLAQLVDAAHRANVPVESWLVVGSQHITAILDQTGEYSSRLVTFFSKALKGTTSTSESF